MKIAFKFAVQFTTVHFNLNVPFMMIVMPTKGYSPSGHVQWAMKVAQSCGPLLELLKNHLRSGPLINMDETTIQVLSEPGCSPTTKSSMWVSRGDMPEKPALIYHYAPSRSSKVAAALFVDYKT